MTTTVQMSYHDPKLTHTIRPIRAVGKMSYQFVVEVWTNAPIETEVELQNAIDLHAPLAGMDLQVTGREMSAHKELEDLGGNADCDFWYFFVEGESKSPYWTMQEIRKAIRNYEPTANLGLQAKSMIQIASLGEREQTVEDVEGWLKQLQDR